MVNFFCVCVCAWGDWERGYLVGDVREGRPNGAWQAYRIGIKKPSCSSSDKKIFTSIMQCIQLSIINYYILNYSMYNSKYNIMYETTYNMCVRERQRAKEREEERDKPCSVTSISVGPNATNIRIWLWFLEPTWWNEKAHYYKFLSVLRTCAVSCRHKHSHTKNKRINISKNLNHEFALSTFSSYKLFLQKKIPFLSFCAK